MRRTGLLALLLGGVVALALGSTAAAADPDGPGVPIAVTIPGSSSGDVAVSNAQLRWGLSTEAGAAAFFGGCNFLSAGAVGDTGGARVWTESDGFYRSSAGNVAIERPLADGSWVPATFATRCQDPKGAQLSTSSLTGSGADVVISGGTGTINRTTGTATIRWTGSFTSVLYGGLTSWWATDPVLTVLADGTATVTATVGGYGTSMTDMTQWVPLAPRTVVLASLSGVSLAASNGFVVTPTYLGVAVSGPGIAQVARTAANAASWGSFPQSFVDFQVQVGQAAYWYASGGVRDAAKMPTRLIVSYDAAAAIQPTSATPASAGATPSNPLRSTPAAGPAGLGSQGDVLGGGETGTSVVAGQVVDTVLPQATLIPAAPDTAVTPTEALLWSSAALLALAALGTVGLSHGWLVLPWTAAAAGASAGAAGSAAGPASSVGAAATAATAGPTASAGAAPPAAVRQSDVTGPPPSGNLG